MRIISILFLLIMIGFAPVIAQEVDFQTGVEHFQNQNYDRAITHLERAINGNPNHKDAYLLLSISYMEENFPILAEETANIGEERFENEGGFLWLKGEALLMMQQPGRASAYYRNLYRYYEDYHFSELLNIDSDRIRNRWADAEYYNSSLQYQSGNIEESLNALDTVIRLNPEHEEAVKNRIYIHVQHENFEEALKLVNSALERFQGDQDLIRMKANIYYNQEDLSGLQEEYRQLYQNDPTDIETAVTYAEILVANQRGGEAEIVIVELIDAHPHNRDVYWELVKLQERRFYILEKAAALEWLLEEFPGDKEALEELAITHEMNSDYQKAREVWRELISEGGDKRDININIAKTYLEEDDFLSARSVLSPLLENYPEDNEIRILLGEVLQELNLWEESLDVFTSFKGEQKVRVVGTEIGYALYQLQRYDEAKAILEDVIESGLQNSLAFLTMAQIEVSTNSDLALNYGIRSVERALIMMQQTRSVIQEKMDESGLFADLNQQERDFNYYNDLAERGFDFLLSEFDESKVEPELLDLIDKNERSPFVYLNVAKFYDKINKTKEALNYVDRSLRLDANLYEGHILMGELHLNLEEFDRAGRAFDRALSIEPESEEAYRKIIESYHRMNNLSELADRWKVKLRVESRNEMLREFLIEILHRTDRFEEAQKIINN